MAASLITESPEKILILWPWPRPNTEMICFPFTASFTEFVFLSRYVCAAITTTDAFLLIIPLADLPNLLNDPIYKFRQVKTIYVYHDNNIPFDRNYFEARCPKLRFCYESDLIKELERPMIDNALNSSRSIDRTAITSFASSVSQRISAKRPRTIQERLHSVSSRGFIVKNMEQIDPQFICPSCRFVIREPWQLNCGHRTCQSCIKVENDEIHCSACPERSSNRTIWLDKAFRRELEKLLISCAICNWTEPLKLYEEHIQQDHYEQEDQPDLSDNLPPLRSMLVLNNDDQRHNLTILSNRVNILNNIQQGNRSTMCSNQNKLQIVSKELSSLRSSLEVFVNLIYGMRVNIDFLHQELRLLEQNIKDRLLASFDGTFLWRITNVAEKIEYARSGRQISIYSPPFYSSPTGYKMRMRLFLNGDGDVRGTYISLFFVLMCNDYDAILQWPFPYKVTFCLIDQSTLGQNQRNIRNSFWPDMELSCFQRPVNGMNEDYGIKKFYPTDSLEKYRNLYIKDDVMFIQTEVHFTVERQGTSGTGATSNSEPHEGVVDEDITRMIA